jgi:hypothetical protein
VERRFCSHDRRNINHRGRVVPSHHLLRLADQQPNYGLWIDGLRGCGVRISDCPTAAHLNLRPPVGMPQPHARREAPPGEELVSGLMQILADA